MVDSVGIVTEGKIIGGKVKLKSGKDKPISKFKLKAIVAKLGSVKLGKVIGGRLKLKLGKLSPMSKDKFKAIVGRDGKVKVGKVIGGIEKEGKEQGPVVIFSLLL